MLNRPSSRWTLSSDPNYSRVRDTLYSQFSKICLKLLK